MSNIKPSKSGIRRKVTLMIFTSIFITMLIGLGMIYILGFNLIRDNIGKEHVQMAQILGSYLNSSISGEIEDVRTYATRPLWIKVVEDANAVYANMDENGLAAYMKKMDTDWMSAGRDSRLVAERVDGQIGNSMKDIVHVRGNIAEIFITDRFGGLVAASGKTSDFYQADEDWWRVAFNHGKGDVYVGDVEFDESSGYWTIPIAVPMFNSKADLVGICKVSLSLSRLFGELERFQIGRTGHAALADRNGMVLYHRGMVPMSRKLFDAKYFLDMKRNASSYGIMNDATLHKDRMLVAYSKVQSPYLADRNIYWLVFISQAADETFKPLNVFIIFMVAVTLVMTLIAVPVGLFFGGIFVAPIHKLHVATERIMKGDWDYKIEVKTGDEIEQFADSFEEMIFDIKNKRAELLSAKRALEELSAGLEDKVNSRTMDLMRAQEAALNILEDLQESKEDLTLNKVKMESMVRSMTEGVIMLDSDGKIAVINPQARWMLGMGFKQDVRDDTFAEKAKEMQIEEAISECRATKGFVVKEVVNPQGQCIKIEINPVRDALGEVIGIALVLRNVTKEKEAEKAKTEFVSMVSHELRTPLSIIKEGVSVMLDKIAGQTTEKQDRILTIAKGNIDRLARIIDELLDISKIESGQAALNKERIDMNSLIRKVAADFEPKIKAKGLSLKVDVPAGEVICYADPDKVIQIFTNLIANAVKFTEKGGVEVGCKDKGDFAECTVSDTGIGISAQDMPKVFRKFQQFSRVAGPGDKGTGLGLSIVKGIVEMHNGKVSVDSEPDKGSAFTFTIHKYSSGELLRDAIEREIARSRSSGVPFSVILVKAPCDMSRDMLKDKISAALRSAIDSIVETPEEIMIVLRNCGKENGSGIISRLRRAIGSEGIRAGLASYPEDSSDENSLIAKARG